MEAFSGKVEIENQTNRMDPKNSPQKRIARLILGALLPPIVGVVVISIPAGAFQSEEIALGLYLLAIIAYVAVGLQSIIYSLIVEFVFRKKLDEGASTPYQYFTMSTVTGMLCGVSFLLYAPDYGNGAGFLYMGAASAASGLVTAFLLKKI